MHVSISETFIFIALIIPATHIPRLPIVVKSQNITFLSGCSIYVFVCVAFFPPLLTQKAPFPFADLLCSLVHSPVILRLTTENMGLETHS